MKQIKVLATLFLLLFSITSYAKSIKEKENYHKAFVEYSPMSFKSNITDDKYKFNGVGVGYNYNIHLSDIPMHLGIGAKFDYYFRNNTSDANVKISDQVLMAAPNINIGVDIRIIDDLYLVPYVGIGMRIGLLGKEKVTAADGQTSNMCLYKKDDMGVNDVWNRTVSSWEAGLNVIYKSYFLGFSFNRDFEKISVNSKQIMAFGIKAGYVF